MDGPSRSPASTDRSRAAPRKRRGGARRVAAAGRTVREGTWYCDVPRPLPGRTEHRRDVHWPRGLLLVLLADVRSRVRPARGARVTGLAAVRAEPAQHTDRLLPGLHARRRLCRWMLRAGRRPGGRSAAVRAVPNGHRQTPGSLGGDVVGSRRRDTRREVPRRLGRARRSRGHAGNPGQSRAVPDRPASSLTHAGGFHLAPERGSIGPTAPWAPVEVHGDAVPSMLT
jgi:hypothetical protein